MQIYIKSAGFSVNQDYSWIDQSGKNVDIDLSILCYNVDDVKFVWKGTGEAIYIFGNAFTDKSRTDLYNRPLRNYILLVGQIDDAVAMSERFEKMLLDQKNFEELLNSSIRNESGDSTVGFSVDFQRIRIYLDSSLPNNREARKLKRRLYEKDSYEARQRLLDELWNIRQKPITLLVGGELSDSRMQTIAPDRALLDYIEDTRYAETKRSRVVESYTSRMDIITVATAIGAVAMTALVLAMVLPKKQD
ncbi:MAG: hypothetical protein NC433_00990 [Clostridiales bacterium]|nr:hypothetical protein [Clostridiales bacterium]